VILVLTDSTDDPLLTTAAPAGSAAVAAVLMWAVQFAWSYLRAPLRLLEDRVEALERSRPQALGLPEGPVSEGEVLRAATLAARELVDWRLQWRTSSRPSRSSSGG
jgi:hypothetical protein